MGTLLKTQDILNRMLWYIPNLKLHMIDALVTTVTRRKHMTTIAYMPHLKVEYALIIQVHRVDLLSMKVDARAI